MAAEWWFYHLEQTSLEAALGPLLEKCLERDWRVLILSPHSQRLAELDAALWTWRDDRFTPHGVAADTALDTRQPILLSEKLTTANEAKVLVLLDGYELGPDVDFERVMMVFDDRDTHARGKARDAFKAAKTAGQTVRYFRQSGAGQWKEQK